MFNFLFSPILTSKFYFAFTEFDSEAQPPRVEDSKILSGKEFYHIY